MQREANYAASSAKSWDRLETSDLIGRVQELTDLELATLLCLIAKEHCIIEHDQGSGDLLEQELQLVGLLMPIHWD